MVGGDIEFNDVYVEEWGGKVVCIGKNYLCEECNFSFIKYIFFKLYFFKYIGEKKYKCEYCNKIFFSFSSLKIYV